MNIDITAAIRPKSDQLNADDLLTGPRTIRIRDVQVVSGEQPVSVFFDGDEGRPWKPAKSALRVLAAVWGPDASRWVGMHCTIYNDETVTWAGVAVGGIRVSAMEGLSQPRTLMLTKTRGRKAGVTIQPLVVSKSGASDRWRERLFAVAESSDAPTVDEAWSKVPEAVKSELGDGLYDQLVALETAAREHRENDPNAAVEALNNEIGGEA
ncbi:hypothetical protein [Rhodovulum euryhalinum]|uniref:Uncharacterized protein n=1 Tax=Rhodovulum euryhalinum TaxID=35805 RepID=A0A4R2KI97_9RHOB|nr:hypothetical protein [Rhodovulum euryhalinum]TCO70246.1 hypothetical protein EV655_11010 [Rhodovulum euryhalinum]